MEDTTKIVNAEITGTDIVLEDVGVPNLVIRTQWIHELEGIVSHKFDGYQPTPDNLTKILSIGGVDRFSKLPGRPVRLKIRDRTIVGIGHFLTDDWFERESEKSRENDLHDRVRHALNTR